MVFADLRAWLRALRATGALLRTHDALARGQRPALGPLLDATDQPVLLPPAGKGFGAALGLYSTFQPLALALGCGPGDTPRALLAAAVARRRTLVDAEFVAPSAAACKQVVRRGAAAELHLLEPQATGQLGARLRGIAICGQPAAGQLHLGLVAAASDGPRHIRLWPALPRDPAWHVLRAAAERGEPAPVAIASGVAPAVTLAAAEQLPAGDPYAVASALLGAPLRITEGESSELEIPTTAELVIEGHLDGTTGDALRVVVEVISHRREPIAEYWHPRLWRSETALLQRVGRGAGLQATLADRGWVIQAVGLYAAEQAEVAILQCREPVGSLDALLAALHDTPWADTCLLVVGPEIDPLAPEQVLRAYLGADEGAAAQAHESPDA
ncbi:MAG TPA: UbiD family decarboxylase domain-containing protein [Chloroflexota bacterium]|nr:UbiD family decarboxylase domain-containing protein [Chloroflexota bacterium]